ncbi:MAG: carboxypeptidase-like regulatory domain-containing protein [Hymenobacter sp.]|nr:MAG: carboxypeptidase-like regulatory domain-containing protein [Hymenobacter sp.]
MKLTVPLLLVALLIGVLPAAAQRLLVTGQVVEAQSGEPVPFASIFVPKTTAGITADLEGRFKISLTGSPDSLAASALGFTTQRKRLTNMPQQTILFRLKKGGGVALGEVVIRPGENPAFRILREVQRHRKENERNALTAAEFDSYNRIEVSMADIPKALANRKVVKDIRALAVRRGAAAAADPDAPRGAGPREGSVLSQMLGSNFQNFDFYPNWQNILGKDFISPIADGGRLTYEYDLQDSVFIEKDWCYKIAVAPKRDHDLAFKGTIWVTAEKYALRRVDLVASEHSNLNFVSDLRIFQDLTPPDQGPGLAARTRLVLGIRPYEKQAALRVRFTTVNSNFVRNQPHEESGFYDVPIVSSILEPGTDAGTNSLVSGLLPAGATEGYFDKNRPDTLSLSERQVFAVLDSARELPSVRSTLDWVDLFINGYKRVGGDQSKIELGPIINTYSHNNFEGSRFRVGFRTTPMFSRNSVVQAYLAYGTQDGRIKYGLRESYIAERRHWTVFTGEFRHDVEQVALLDNDFLPDNNLFVAASRWGLFTEGRAILRNLASVSVQRDLFHGFTQTATLRYQGIKPLHPFSYYDSPDRGANATLGRDLNLSELVLESRYAPDENLVQAENRRRAIGLKKLYTIGSRNYFDDSNHPFYQKYNLLVTHSFSAGHFGRLAYRVEGSYIPNAVPYIILKTPLGNETPFFNVNAFNLMRYFEFVTDRSVSLRLDHHFEGIILNSIPGIRRFNWRLVATANALYGGLTTTNQNLLPPFDKDGHPLVRLYSLRSDTPYVEAGYGIENIFKFVRVDFIHRLTYRNLPGAKNFGVKVGAQFRL